MANHHVIHCWWFRNPQQPPGCIKTSKNYGINNQPQLVQVSSINSTSLLPWIGSFHLSGTTKWGEREPSLLGIVGISVVKFFRSHGPQVGHLGYTDRHQKSTGHVMKAAWISGGAMQLDAMRWSDYRHLQADLGNEVVQAAPVPYSKNMGLSGGQWCHGFQESQILFCGVMIFVLG